MNPRTKAATAPAKETAATASITAKIPTVSNDRLQQESAPPVPHAPGIEKAVLSVIFQYPEQLSAAPDLTPRHFHIPAHRDLFAHIRDRAAAGLPVELVSFTQHLIDRGILARIGGPSALAEIYCYQPTPQQFRHHVDQLAFHAARREMLEHSDRLRSAAFESCEPVELAEALRGSEAIRRILSKAAAVGFPITPAAEIEEAAEARDFVERLLTESAASVVYGPSNTAKTFWILDMAAAVATGRPFRDELETEQGAVVYVALEGNFGIRNRILAMRRAGKLDDCSPLYLCFAALNLLEAGHAAKLAETVKQAAAQSEMPCRLVVIDTMARAMAGGDENKAADMTAAVAAIDAVRAATGAHVAIVHHTGKDEAKGARGHSSLRAAVDTEIEVFRPEGESVSTVRITKQRDMPLGEPMPFSLKVIELGTDRRGNPITSCVVHHEDSIMAASPAKAGRKPLCSPDDMLRFLPAENVTEWQRKVAEETGLGRSAFYLHKRTLESSGKIRKEVATNRILPA